MSALAAIPPSNRAADDASAVARRHRRRRTSGTWCGCWREGDVELGLEVPDGSPSPLDGKRLRTDDAAAVARRHRRRRPSGTRCGCWREGDVELGLEVPDGNPSPLDGKRLRTVGVLVPRLPCLVALKELEWLRQSFTDADLLGGGVTLNIPFQSSSLNCLCHRKEPTIRNKEILVKIENLLPVLLFCKDFSSANICNTGYNYFSS
ncbi:unnamed protein product [Triticum turgidum subsp. durum]|uniref:Uncharacterized protein n=1 Tax=Triticum turgidum subsp. durum TaxID=4567 RepID=A0A9R0XXY0_TRITD|nr:unnamed protein product [Triticum turgidum subsp. durum]